MAWHGRVLYRSLKKQAEYIKRLRNRNTSPSTIPCGVDAIKVFSERLSFLAKHTRIMLHVHCVC